MKYYVCASHPSLCCLAVLPSSVPVTSGVGEWVLWCWWRADVAGALLMIWGQALHWTWKDFKGKADFWHYTSGFPHSVWIYTELPATQDSITDKHTMARTVTSPQEKYQKHNRTEGGPSCIIGVPQQVSIYVLRARKQSGVIFPCMLAAYWIHAIFFSAHVYICLHVNMSASESLKFYTYKKCFLYKCACCHHKTVLCDFEKLRAKKKKKGTLGVILWKDFWPHSSHYCNSTHHFNVLTARFWSKTTSLYKNLHIYHVTHRYFFS